MHSEHAAATGNDRSTELAFHQRPCGPKLPMTNRYPSGLNVTSFTTSVCPVSGGADGLAGVGVPQPHGGVEARAREAVPVGAECDTVYPVGAGEVPIRRLHNQGLVDELAVPNPYRAVRAGAGQPVSVGAEMHFVHRVGMPGERGPDGLAGVGVPQPDGLVDARAREAVPVGAELHAVHPIGVPGQGARWVGRCRRSTAARSCRRSRWLNGARRD